jgi:hypothetical protein
MMRDISGLRADGALASAECNAHHIADLEQ